GGVNLSDGEAALLALLLALYGHYLRVRGDELQALAVHHEQAQGEAHLRRGKPHALGRVHRLEHVRRETFELSAELLDGLAQLLQNLLGKLRYLKNRHAPSLKQNRER